MEKYYSKGWVRKKMKINISKLSIGIMENNLNKKVKKIDKIINVEVIE